MVHVSVIVNESFVVVAKEICKHAYQCNPWLCRLSGSLVWGMVPEVTNVYIRLDPDYIVQLLLSASLKDTFRDLHLSPAKILSRRWRGLPG